MWRNPAYPARQQPTAPEERGERLATIPRGPTEELRVSLDEFNGHPFVSVRLWVLGSDGQHWPTKKGLSIRIRELAEVATALMRARDLVFSATEGSARSEMESPRRSLPARGGPGEGHRRP
jgi:Transcriptional Coactivator p15 (PC4)